MHLQGNESIPVIPSRNVVIFPGNTAPVRVGRAKSKAAIEQAQAGTKLVVLLSQKDVHKEDEPKADDLHRVGTLWPAEISPDCQVSTVPKVGTARVVETVQLHELVVKRTLQEM